MTNTVNDKTEKIQVGKTYILRGCFEELTDTEGNVTGYSCYEYRTNDVSSDFDTLHAEAMREKRDELLKTYVDPYQLALRYEALAKEGKTDELATYRDALLTVPEQDGFPETIEWPEIPEFLK